MAVTIPLKVMAFSDSTEGKMCPKNMKKKKTFELYNSLMPLLSLAVLLLFLSAKFYSN